MGIVRRAQGARRKAMSVRIVDDEQRSDRPQDPCGLRVAAAGGRLLRCGGSTMCTDVACAAAPSIRPPGARNAAICTFTTDCWARAEEASTLRAHSGPHGRRRITWPDLPGSMLE